MARSSDVGSICRMYQQSMMGSGAVWGLPENEVSFAKTSKASFAKTEGVGFSETHFVFK